MFARFRLDESKFSSDALEGLAEFSHVEVLFHLQGLGEASVIKGRKYPLSNPNWPQVGMPKEGKLVLTELPQQSVGCFLLKGSALVFGGGKVLRHYFM